MKTKDPGVWQLETAGEGYWMATIHDATGKEYQGAGAVPAMAMGEAVNAALAAGKRVGILPARDESK